MEDVFLGDVFGDNAMVITRTGAEEYLDIAKIKDRITSVADREPKISIDATLLTAAVFRSLQPNMKTTEIDELIASMANNKSMLHPEYGAFAARLTIDNFHRETLINFFDKTKALYYSIVKSQKGTKTLLTKDYYTFVEQNHNEISSMIDYSRDFLFDYFGIKTFQRLYALKDANDKIVERPQDTYMRTAIVLHKDEPEHKNRMKAIKETYDALSLHDYTHASPTYFNGGTYMKQLASCFLFGMDDDTDAIGETNKDIAKISKSGGGIGIHQHGIRSTGAKIRSSNGTSSGIVPFNRMFGMCALAFNQRGKRNGSVAIYLMMHHPDIRQFLALKLPEGPAELRAKDLFYGLWIPDLFMKRLKNAEIWSLFDPDATIDLSNYSGEEYEKKYLELEEKKLYKEQIPAIKLWEDVLLAQEQTGMPYICFADTVNALSNQKNLGTIKSSNLCTEIMLYSDFNEYAVCNLCSINLTSLVRDTHKNEDGTRVLNHKYPVNPVFDFDKLIQVARLTVRNLNRVIDVTQYPLEKCMISNLKNRPLGIGVQGLANVYCKMRVAFESKEASQLNSMIFETLYYAAMSESAIMCRNEYLRLEKKLNEEGSVEIKKFNCSSNKEETFVYYKNDTDNPLPRNVYAYPSMTLGDGSPISKGIFHFEMYADHSNDILSGRYDWDSLRELIKIYGVRNSQLIALMPTASTSQLLGNNECFEPFTYNLYTRSTIAGSFTVINNYLIEELKKIGLWSNQMSNAIQLEKGSIQNIGVIPAEIRELFKTAYEMDQNYLIKQAADRQRFVDQAESLNLYYPKLDRKEFTLHMFKAWEQNLKTGKYYTHSQPVDPDLKFTASKSEEEALRKKFQISKKPATKKEMVSKDFYKYTRAAAAKDEICIACSS